MRKTYKSYKNSGVDWIGEIPSHWLLRKLKHNTYIKARVGWHGLKSTEFKDEGPYCVTGTDFIDGRIQWEGCYRVSKERYDEDPYIQLKEDDLLITKDGTIGKTAVVGNLPGPCTLNSGVFVVRPEADYTSKYLYWVLNSSIFTEFVNFYSKGSTIIHLYQDTFCNLPQPIPSLEEQYKISDYLDEKTALIDSTIRKKEKLIELLQEERTAIINQAVTRGLDPNVKMKDSGVEWLGEIPEHWSIKKVKYVLENHDFKRVPLSSEERGKMDERVYDYYGASGVIDKVESYLFDGEYILLGEDGANLLTRSTALAFKATGKFWVNNHAHILKPRKGNLDFYVELLECIDYSVWVSGSAQPKLTAENLGNMHLPVPPQHEQDEISAYIIKTKERSEAVVSKIKSEVQLLDEYRTALINEVVTGKRCVI